MALRRGACVALAGLSATTAFRYRNVVQRQAQLPSTAFPVFCEKPPQDSSRNKRHVLVIGAGVVGVSTAYKLAQRGHQVVILEPMSAPGEECSACAAGGMSRQNVVVDKGTWITVLQCLAPKMINRLVWGRSHKDDDFEFFRISWGSSLSDPFFLRWAWTFTMTSFFPSKDHSERQQQMLKFTEFSVDDMVSMFEDKRDIMARKVGYNPRGSLAVLYEKPVTNQSNHEVKDAKSGHTLEPHRLIHSTQEILREEPSLRFQARLPVAARYEYESKAASSGRFTKELARRLMSDPELDVTFIYDTKVQGITTSISKESKKPHISEIQTNRGSMFLPEDVVVVVATGAWTPHVLALMNLYAPVYPLKGYAMSVSAKQALKVNPALSSKDLPSRIVCDKFMYTTRLGDEIRITSIGEFSEWDTRPTPNVDANFRREAARQFPQLKELIAKSKTYCGHRPYVADGILLLGEVGTHENLYLSCGPGSNGWKLALGSGEVIARLISGQSYEQMKAELGFDASAFSPTGRVLAAPLFARICRAGWNV